MNPTTNASGILYTFSDQVAACCSGQVYNDNSSVQAAIPDTTGVLFIQDNATVSLFDLSTGSQIGSAITMNGSTQDGVSGPPYVGHMIVAGDGNAYVPYLYSEATTTSGGGTATIATLEHLMLLRVSPDGSFSNIGLKDLNSRAVETNQGTTFSGSGFFASSFALSGQSPEDLSVITNGASGATVFVPECDNFADTPCDVQTAMFGVSNDSVVLRTNVALSGFLPSLQREDGSYVGVDPNDNVDALGPDGGILWKNALTTNTFYDGLSRVTPLYATSDGGVIVTTSIPSCAPGNIGFDPLFLRPICQLSNNEPFSLPYSPAGQLGTLYTLDQYGSVTAQTADTGTRLSWTGNWYADPVGMVSSFSFQPLDFALSLGAFGWGNPSAAAESIPGAAARPWKFALVWANDYTFTPSNPSLIPSLTTGISSISNVIQKAALKSLGRAYLGFPVEVIQGEIEQPIHADAQAVVHDHQNLKNDYLGGATPPVPNQGKGDNTISQIDYINLMIEAQFALNIVINNAQDEAAAIGRPDLIDAIGSGIGNTAAHELAHQFLIECCDMDSNPFIATGSNPDPTHADPNARGTYNAGGFSGKADPSLWIGYWPNPKIDLHWEDTPTNNNQPNALIGLNHCLRGGFHETSTFCQMDHSP